MAFLNGRGVVTSSVREEIDRWRKKRYSALGEFLAEIDSGRVRVIDPDLEDTEAARVITTWDAVFGKGEVSSIALAVSRRWIFVSRDREPMRQVILRESIAVQSTEDVLGWLVRRKKMTKTQAQEFMRQVLRQ